MLNYFIKSLSIVFILIFINNCCFDNPIESYLELNPDLTDETMNSINLKEGLSYDSLELKNGEYWQFGINVPELNENSKVPLIFALSGDGEGRGEYIPYLECQVIPGLENLNGIIFAPDNRDFNIWEYDNVTLILTIINYAIKNWPIDENKIIVTGHSNGGYGAWYFGINYPQVFSAAIPIASRMEYPGNSFIRNKKLQIPFYVIHSTSDQLFDINDVSNKIKSLVDLGSDIKFEKIDYVGHNSVCAYSMYLKKSIEWLNNKVWK